VREAPNGSRESRCGRGRLRRFRLHLRRHARQGRQEGRRARQRAGLAAHRSDQLRHLGTAHQARRRPDSPRRQEPVRLCQSGRLRGRRRGFALLRAIPALSADRLQDEERAQSRARLADRLRRRGAILRPGRGRYRRLRRRQGGGEMAAGGRALSDAADENLSRRKGVAERRASRRHRSDRDGQRHELDEVQGPRRLSLRRLVPPSPAC